MIHRVTHNLAWVLIVAILFAGLEGASEAHAHGLGQPSHHADAAGQDGDGLDGSCESCAHAGAHVLGPAAPLGTPAWPGTQSLTAGVPGLSPAPGYPPPLRPPDATC